MKRRRFLKIAGATLPLWFLPRHAWGVERPAFAERIPETPFDAPSGSWTLAVLPDTQNYSSSFPQVFQRQTEWLAAHRKSHAILFVAHEGDIVNEQRPEQWAHARQAMSVLNDARLPYSLIPGNHDLGPLGNFCGDRSTLLNVYFKSSDYEASPSFGLFERAKMENSWHRFDSPTGKYLILALEHGPRDEVVEGARGIAESRSDHKIILVTHAYLYCDSRRYGEGIPGRIQKWNPKHHPGLLANGGSVNEGRDLWAKLVSKCRGFQFTLNGHMLDSGTGYLASRAADGHLVHQILANYQAGVQTIDGAGGVAYAEGLKGMAAHGRAWGGGGFLRLMQFYPDKQTVVIKTYSPWYDRWLTQPDQQFMVSLS